MGKYTYEFSDLSISEKYEDLADRTKKLYGKIVSKAIADSFEYMESEDVAMLKDSIQIMEDALGLTVEWIKLTERNGKETERLVLENNRMLKDLVDSKREV